ncbi:MAG TPA: glutamine-hydrolyzing carbamoyl-phosphate synthase small subunit [Phycisphaerae bacterium]|nr:glutamine-hydrolyzing carbamoyl-phosphate synthase small subunit [Phycisphaerae bacterium]
MKKPAKAVLILEDGARFEGNSFGHAGDVFGVAVFFTGVVGYHELLTNPSYRGTLAVLTYPIIGACGVNADDNESPAVHPAGLIVREYSRTFSNFRATGSLEDFLKAHRVVGISQVDTRAVAVHLRDHGQMQAAIVRGKSDATKVAAKLRAAASAPARDLAAEATWAGKRRARGKQRGTLALVNLGVKESLLDQLADLGFAVRVVPHPASARQVLAGKPKGIILAGGPGDPRALEGAVATTKALLGKAPLLGIGLGHQVLALALGCRVERMKTGHRGVNCPVKELTGGRLAITVQHHGYAVDGDSMSDGVEVTHTNLNDGTIEGVGSQALDAAGVQFHPCRDETEAPDAVLARFSESL